MASVTLLSWREICLVTCFDVTWSCLCPLVFQVHTNVSNRIIYRYTALVEHNVLQAAKDMEKVLDVSLSQIAEDHPLPSPIPSPSYPLLSRKFFRRHGRNLLSCASTWFLLDVAFYSTNLFQSKIYHRFIPEKSRVNAFEAAFEVAKLQAIVAACSTIPGMSHSAPFSFKPAEFRRSGSAMCLLYGLKVTGPPSTSLTGWGG